ncbi:MAG: hypothetical protein AAGE52_02485 [Myxococcota bacterium]
MTQLQNNPIADWWTNALKAQVEQMNAMVTELGKLEAKGVEQATTAIDEAARLSKAGLEAAMEMQSAWRRIAVESSKRGPLG